MKSRKPSITFRSFQDLKDLLEANALSLPDFVDSDPREDEEEPGPEDEEELFTKAMEGVKPISRDNYVERIFQIRPAACAANGDKDDAEVLLELTNLVRYGTGFRVSDTPEYVEGTGYHVHPGIARRLHRGDYSIQAYVDLHGLNVEEAKEVFEEFLKWSLTTGKTGVLIVHGRGLSSPSEPVLKNKVIEWLKRSLWRKWVVAYTSARSCDGGAGATYVLLRRRPAKKRLKTGRIGT
jgi:DNA-nicking Smr family endonuclease